MGTTYVFKVKSRNQFDFSPGYSNEVTILAAMTPEKPLAPVTSVTIGATTTDNVIITWTAPYDNGSPILGYKVYVRQENLIYTMETTNCDGSQTDIMTAT
jgi:hypothetical protein